MKKLWFCCILALAWTSVICAQSTSAYVAPDGTWIWSLGDDENEQPVGEIVLKPGYVENPVHGNVFANESYLITADEGMPIYAPVEGTVEWMGIVIDSHSLHSIGFYYHFEDIDLSEWAKGMNPDEVENFKSRTPPITPEDASKIIAIKMNDGKTLWLTGFLDINVEEGQKLAKGQQIGTLGYNPMYYKDPSLKLSLSTKEGRRSTELGEYLLGENNSQFFSEYLLRF